MMTMARGLRLGLMCSSRKRKRYNNSDDAFNDAYDDYIKSTWSVKPGEPMPEPPPRLKKRIEKDMKKKVMTIGIDYSLNKLNRRLERERESERDFSLRKCSEDGSRKKINYKKKKRALRIGDRVNLSDILFTKKRDFLVTYNDRNRPVQAKHLQGKTVVLHFVPLVPWNSHLKLYVTSLVDTYNALQPNGGFEVVFVGVKFGKFPSNPCTLLNRSLEKRFEQMFSIMPWTAIPFSDIVYQRSLERRLNLRFSHCVCPTFTASVVIDPTGLVLQNNADDTFLWYGARAYPFSLQRVKCIVSEDEKALDHPSITRLLTSLGRDYVINKENKEVPVRDLEDKVVALYFYEDFPTDDLTKSIQAAYEQLADKEKFEVVLVYLHDSFDSCEFASEKSFWKKFNKMPWLALPYKDPRCQYLKHIFEYPVDLDGPGPDPRLVIIGPQGKFVEPFGFNILKEFGVSAYPFTRKRVAELQAEYLKKLELNMLLDPKTSFTRENGSKVKLSQLKGKRIILFIEDGWVTKYPEFWQRLKARYLEMKDTSDAFEVIQVPYDMKSKYCEYDANIPWLRYDASIPWLRRRPFRLESEKYSLLNRVFSSYDGLLAFDSDGRVLRRTSAPSIEEGDLDFPFYAGGLEKEALDDLIDEFQWESELVRG